MNLDNLILLTDSYKVGHYRQYPPGTTAVYSYFESRGGKFPECVFFGLQYIIKKHLVGQVVTEEKVREAREVFDLHFGDPSLFYEEGWRYILNVHGGRLPIIIRAIPEGTIVPVKNVLFTIENTDPKCFWLTNYLETILMQLWYPITVATSSLAQRRVVEKYMKETCENLDTLQFKLHDFGFRGVTSVEQAGIGGLAHLTSFQGFSIAASEHSTITSWGREHEVDAFRNMLTQYPNGTVACVSDSWDLFAACKDLWGTELKDLVVARGARGGGLVIRPDSGDPPTMVLKCLELLANAFGTSVNSRGYKELPTYVRLIQGDGINLEMIETILNRMKEQQWSAENVAFGSGGALLQIMNRDTQKVAIKCSNVTIDGKDVPVYKDPATDPGKKSKKGRLTLEFSESSGWQTVTDGLGLAENDRLRTVFENGVLLEDDTLTIIRKRIHDT